MKKLELNLLNSKLLIDFISKFKSIDKNILLEISSDKLSAKSYKESQSSFKYGEINFSDLFTFTKKNDSIDNTLKIWIYNIDKFKKALNVIGDCKMILSFDENDPHVTQIDLKTKNTKKSLTTLNELNFLEITEEQIEKVFDIDSAIFSLDLTKDFIEKLTSLSDLESNSYIKIQLKNNKVLFTGSEFSLSHDNEVENDVEMISTIDKDIFQYTDNENYTLYVKENSILLFDENNFKLAIALVDDSTSIDEDDSTSIDEDDSEEL